MVGKWLSFQAAVFQPVDTDLKIYDFSVSSPDQSKFLCQSSNTHVLNLRSNAQKSSHLLSTNSLILGWFASEWVSPTYFRLSPHHNMTNFFPSLFHLVIATNIVLYRKGGQQSKPIEIPIETCLNFLDAILMARVEYISITPFLASYNISCKKNVF